MLLKMLLYFVLLYPVLKCYKEKNTFKKTI